MYMYTVLLAGIRLAIKAALVTLRGRIANLACVLMASKPWLHSMYGVRRAETYSHLVQLCSSFDGTIVKREFIRGPRLRYTVSTRISTTL